ncbi:endonuclease domain-containing protein [Blastococcus sp. LR1]|uniref:endonuclease domain-containing protein n=1 Tax=Blastococcus sp. LR1 TaxID=2877000 RepID=UPI001CCE3EBE|nr:endonuclease domain-containing protein [Blastococcus sp. LR1]MCA0144582.1 endonuclease domain-containing protein [Blastococcus sp. LR1]
MPPVAVAPPTLRQGAFRGSRAVADGLLTPNQLRGPAWRRLFEDVYVHDDHPVTHALRACAAAALVVPGSVVTGRSAAVLWGVDMAAVETDVELTMPPSANPRRIPGVQVRRAALPVGHVRLHRDVPVTSPAATALRLASSSDGDEAVVAVDRLAAAGLTTLQDVRSLAADARGPGASRARRACALADGLAQSPQETRLRLLVGRSALPPPVAQFTVRDRAGFVARVDFAWPERKVALEYDGLWHAAADQFAHDRRRLNRLHAAGWRVFFVTAADLRDPAQHIARVVAFLDQATVR